MGYYFIFYFCFATHPYHHIIHMDAPVKVLSQKPWIVATAAAMQVTSVEDVDGDW